MEQQTPANTKSLTQLHEDLSHKLYLLTMAKRTRNKKVEAMLKIEIDKISLEIERVSGIKTEEGEKRRVLMTKKYIKGFDKNLMCRDFQFEVGKEYKIELNGRKLELCTDTGFHFCDSLQRVHNFYSVHPKENNRFCEITVLGELVEDAEKCISNHIRIVREIKGQELDILRGLTGGNTGIFNTGDYNTGYYNTGDCNTGDCNTGDCNTGYYNTGDYNTGYYNTGYRNTGDYNTGYFNTGYRNTGDNNTGYFNTGDRNTGDFNSGNRNTGLFNTDSPMIRLFNKESNMTNREFYASKYWLALISQSFVLTEWYEFTEEEKENSVIRQAIGGKLIKHDYKDACAIWWNKLSEEAKETIKDMPNFDANIFKEITGIVVSKLRREKNES